MSAATVPSELPVFTLYYALLVWTTERAEAFPKALRATITHRFIELLVKGLEELLELRYTREREQLFRAVNMTFEKLRVLSRVLKDRRVWSVKQYEHFNRELDTVGRMLGGWRKANAQVKNASAQGGKAKRT